MARMSDLIRYLKNNGVEFQVIKHDPAFTTHDVASVAHVPESSLVKTILLRIDGKYWMAVVRGDQRVNEKLLKKMLGANHVRLAHEEDLKPVFPDCELGAMPPFGNLYGLPVIVEKLVEEQREITFNACTHSDAIRMQFGDYARLVQPIIARFAETPHIVPEQQHIEG